MYQFLLLTFHDDGPRGNPRPRENNMVASEPAAFGWKKFWLGLIVVVVGRDELVFVGFVSSAPSALTDWVKGYLSTGLLPKSVTHDSIC